MRINPTNPQALIKAAQGHIAVDILLKNVQVVNLFTGEIAPGAVGIFEGMIAFVDFDPENLNRETLAYQAKQTIDGHGQYLIPGFIDAHLHIESTMMTPRHFSAAVLPWGTTTVVIDPHEIGNVLGAEGVKYMAQSVSDLPIRYYVLAPSCVPALPGMESSGADFYATDIQQLTEAEGIFGIGEVMDFHGVLNNDARMVDILKQANQQHQYIQGHAPGMFGRRLNAYLCSGPTNDHESRSGQEAKDKMRLGMYVDARESSASQNVRDIVEAVKDFRYHDLLCLCTDDREASDILESGHMNYVVKTAIDAGLDPITAIRCATLHTARDLGVRNLGAVAPGYVADVQFIESLTEPRPSLVISHGQIVARDNQLVTPFASKMSPVEALNTVDNIPLLSESDLTITAPLQNGTVNVNVMHYLRPNGSLTEWRPTDITVKDGKLQLPEGHMFALVQNRYGLFDQRTLAVVSGFGLREGAIASTVSHDSHNLTAIFDTPANALVAIQQVIEQRGGIASCANGEVSANIPLQVAGLMSLEPCEVVAQQSEQMKAVLRFQGLTEAPNPTMRISTMALPVIPKAKLSDKGLIDVANHCFVPLFIDE
ncbi:adenine deaminase [Vibrio sp. CAIM 722]|uniref:Adenine deaminase n=1 Tax=Vibrio eleionomae TaxID=2653505 RepID=A0A7X4RTT4_9VIBR|nr:adenine deaminase [Vibrio eleionomae]MZI93171.1 adenine deaminase [Vibrio eleionomae]